MILISVKLHTDGKYYWTLDDEWLTDGSANKLPVTGEKGDPGKDGQNGTNGTNGITPKIAIGYDGNWYISANGTAKSIPFPAL